MSWSAEELESWIDRTAVDPEGTKIGTIADVYMDDSTGQPEWLAVMTGLFGSRISFVPLAGATQLEQNVAVAYSKAVVKDSPNVDADGQLSEDEEERLYSHYGLTYSSTKPAADTILGVEQASEQIDSDLLETGSASLGQEVSAETARLRLRRRDAEALSDVDLPVTADEYRLGVEDVDRKDD